MNTSTYSETTSKHPKTGGLWRTAMQTATVLAASLLLLNCADSRIAVDEGEDDANVLPGFEVRTERVLVTTSDFSASETFLFDPQPLDEGGAPIVSEPRPNADQDTVPVFAFTRSLLLARTDGVVRIQDIDDPLTTETVTDLRDGIGAPSPNPQQVVSALRDRKAYVVQQQANTMSVLRLLTNGSIALTGSVDLSTFVDPADADGLVDMAGAVAVGERALYVALGRYDFDDDFVQRFPSTALIVAIDKESDRLIDLDEGVPGIQGIELQGQNPAKDLIYDEASNALFVHVRGAWGVADGGIERVDLNTMRSTGLVLSETELSAELFAVKADAQEQSAEAVFLQVGSEVLAFDATTGRIESTPVASGIEGFGSIEVFSNRLYAWSLGETNRGLRVFAVSGRQTEERTDSASPLTFGNLPIAALAPAR